MPCRQCNDQFALSLCQSLLTSRSDHHSEAGQRLQYFVRSPRQCAGLTGTDLHLVLGEPIGRDNGKLACSSSPEMHPAGLPSRYLWCNFFKQLEPFSGPRCILWSIKPVALPSGSCKTVDETGTRPDRRQSENTIGTVRVACSNGLTVEAPWARMTSGASATSSVACLRISSALPLAQPGVDPHVLADAPAGLLQPLHESPDADLIFFIICRCQGGLCQCAASGQVAARAVR